MALERRLLSLLLLLGVVGAPALALRLACIGNACDTPAAAADTPFCSLPSELRRLIGNGYREGPAAEVLAVAREEMAGGTFFEGAKSRPPWPSLDGDRGRVPLGLWLLEDGAMTPALDDVPAGTGLDAVAPTLASLLGVERPHPEVRSGRPLAGATATEAELAVQVVWKGVGSADLEEVHQSWERLAGLVATEGTMDASTGSLPLDPAAVLTTIGTGGTPSQHGVTGSLVHTEDGDLVSAFSRKAPVYVIATLGDDLDEVSNQRADVALIAHAPVDRGLMGKDWYVEADHDEVRIVSDPRDAAAQARLHLAQSGDNGTPDLLSVTLQGSIEAMAGATQRIIAAADDARDDPVVFAFTTTGSAAREEAAEPNTIEQDLNAALPTSSELLEAFAPGGLFLDQQALADEEITQDRVVEALRRMEGGTGNRLFADVFPAIAVSFGRYC